MLPRPRRVREQVLRVERAVRMADEVHRRVAVPAERVLDEALGALDEAVHVRRKAGVVPGDPDVPVRARTRPPRAPRTWAHRRARSRSCRSRESAPTRRAGSRTCCAIGSWPWRSYRRVSSLSSHTWLKRRLGLVVQEPVLERAGARARGRDSLVSNRDQELREVKRREEDDRRAVRVRRAGIARGSRSGERDGDREAGRHDADQPGHAHPFTLHPRRRPGSLAYQLLPRATVTASPLTPDAASPHRNTITSATSRGVRTRPGGYEAARSVHT